MIYIHHEGAKLLHLPLLELKGLAVYAEALPISGHMEAYGAHIFRSLKLCLPPNKSSKFGTQTYTSRLC